MEPVKFTFDTSFDQAPEEAEAAEAAAQAQALEAARQEGFVAGQDAGRAEALAGLESQAAQALEQVLSKADQLLGAHAQEVAGLAQDCAAIALKGTQLLAGPLLEEGAQEVVLDFVGSALTECLEERRLVLRVAPDLQAHIAAQVETVSAAAQFEGQLVVMADDAFAGADCALEWPDGGQQRKRESLDAAMTAAVARFAQFYVAEYGQTEPAQ